MGHSYSVNPINSSLSIPAIVNKHLGKDDRNHALITELEAFLVRYGQDKYSEGWNEGFSYGRD